MAGITFEPITHDPLMNAYNQHFTDKKTAVQVYIAFIMSSSASAWLLSPWSVLLRNKMAGRFASVSEDELCERYIIKQLLNSVFA